MNGRHFLDMLWQDLRYACRGLRKSPAFTLIAVLSLALGIGANTAVFSLVRAVLLRSLPFPQPDRLVRVAHQDTLEPVSVPEFEFGKQHVSAFASVAAHRGSEDRGFASRATREWIKVMPVTDGFFRTLGVAPLLGREFQPEETRSAAPQAIVLGEGLWRRAFAADSAVLGRAVMLGQTSYTVVGVLPRGFWFPQAADAFVPLRTTGGPGDQGTNTEMIARLNPGVGLPQARATISALTDGFRRVSAAGQNASYRGLTLIPYQAWLVGDVRVNLLLLFGAVAFLLLIACSNVAGLLLARLAAREKEIAVRLALGSGPARLLRQFLIENTLLGLAGGLAGFLTAWWLLDGLLALIPFDLPASAPIRLDLPVLAFTLAIAVAAALLFSLAPFLTSYRLDLQQTLKAAGRSAGADGARQRTRSFLLVGQVALSVTLLVAAALLIQSLYRIHQERLGFDPRGLITFWTPRPSGSPAGLRRFESTLLERLQSLPGVRAVAAVNVLPLSGQNNFPTERDGHPDETIGGMEVRLVTPAYFAAMATPILRGRSFTPADTAAAPPVILINETLARRWWPRANPLGDRVVVGRFQGRDLAELQESPREVVGVVADTKTVYLKEPPRPTVYLPSAQAPWYDFGMNWVVRADLSAGFAGLLRQTIADIDPRQRVERLRTMDEIVASTTAESRFDAWLFAIFAALALLLTSIGVYGLLSFSVARRTREIGARMALGASRAGVLRLVLKQGLTLTAIGLLLGLAGALALSRSLSTLLYGVRPTDPLSFLAAAALLLAVGAVASYLPARRATKVDPVVALRYE